MEQYIPKAALVAEIERLREEKGTFYASDVLYNLEDFLDTLEVKEVDIDEEINEHAEYMPQSEFPHDCEVLENIEWAKNEFRYFFELGMAVSNKQQKG
jgi:hypothetical protein